MNERLWGILIDAFPKLLMYGIEVTVPLTILSFALALIISVIVALIQYADVKVLRQICRFYIWIVRGTPLLVQLYLVFYGLPSLGVSWRQATACACPISKSWSTSSCRRPSASPSPPFPTPSSLW